jgi:hypothetical protein
MTVTIAMAQIAPAWEDPQATLRRAIPIIKEASSEGADLICFPEQFATGWDPESSRNAQTIDGNIVSGLADAAGEHGIAVLGSLRLLENGSLFNAAVAIGAQGEVIGISTEKLVGKGVSGIAFALSVGDLLAVLRRFYPSTVSAAESGAENSPNASGNSEELKPPNAATSTGQISLPENPAAPKAPSESAFATVAPGIGTVSISSDPDGAEIYVDGKFFGNAPATLKLPSGSHEIVLKAPGRTEWRRTLEILKGNKTTLDATLVRAR